jgi:hypothetical protein
VIVFHRFIDTFSGLDMVGRGNFTTAVCAPPQDKTRQEKKGQDKTRQETTLHFLKHQTSEE